MTIEQKFIKVLRRLVREMVREEQAVQFSTPQQLRVKANLSLEELAARLKEKGFDTSVRQLQRYEAGKAGDLKDRRVEKRVKAISEVLGCTELEYHEALGRTQS